MIFAMPEGRAKARQVVPIILMIFGDFFGQNLIFPFLPFMVKDFLDVKRSEVGFYSGFLAASYAVGTLFGSLMWGAAADRFGRRPALLASLSLSMIWMVVFGFSRAFWWAVLARFLWGLSSGIVGIGKTVLSESSTNKSAARTFSFVGVSSGLGRLVGPATGGILVGFIPGLPYLLPLLVCVGFSGASLILSFFFLKETLVKGGKKSSSPLPRTSSPTQYQTENTEQMELLPASSNRSASNDVSIDIGDQDVHGDSLHSDHDRTRQIDWMCCFRQSSSLKSKASSHPTTGATTCFSASFARFVNTLRDYSHLLSDPVIRTTCIAYTLLALTAAMHQQLIPLLLVVNFAHGGLCMNSAEIGIVLAVVGVFQLLVQLALYPPFSKKLGHRKLFQLGLIGFSVFLVLLPWTSAITGSQDPFPAAGETTPSAPFPQNLSNISLGEGSGNEFYPSPGAVLPIDGERQNLTNITMETERAGVLFVKTASNFNTKQAMPSSVSSTPSGVCSLRLNVSTNNTDECGRALSNGGRSNTVNFALLSCLPWSVWLTVTVIIGGAFLTRTFSFTSMNILVGNSCAMEVRARVNGLGMALSSLGRIAGPIIVSNVFAATDTDDSSSTFVPEHHVSAWLTAFVAIVAVLVSLKLPASVEKKKASVMKPDKEPSRSLLPESSPSHGTNTQDDDVNADYGNHDDRASLIPSQNRKNEHECESVV